MAYKYRFLDDEGEKLVDTEVPDYVPLAIGDAVFLPSGIGGSMEQFAVSKRSIIFNEGAVNTLCIMINLNRSGVGSRIS